MLCLRSALKARAVAAAKDSARGVAAEHLGRIITTIPPALAPHPPLRKYEWILDF